MIIFNKKIKKKEVILGGVASINELCLIVVEPQKTDGQNNDISLLKK
jgi:hypothetical protein